MWHDFIQYHANTRPHHIALVDRSNQTLYSYQQLEAKILGLANQLLTLGVGVGDRVVFLASASLYHITLFFACAKLGAILVPLNHRLSQLEVEEIVQQLDARCLLTIGQQPGFVDVTSLSAGAHQPVTAVPLSDDHVMMILYTSGSTGRPKGVLFHAAMIMANMHHTVAADVLRPTDISIVNTPFFHTGGYHVFCLPLLSIGGTLILHDRFDPGAVLSEINQAGVSVFWAVPTMFQAIFDHPNFATTSFANIRFFLSGGAPLSLALIQGYHRHGVPFKQGFGLTEVGPNCFLLETDQAFVRPDSIGKPMSHSQVLVVDEAGLQVAPNQVGEMLITGPHLCKGYWQQEELFRNSLKNGYFATGDLVRMDEEGFFYVIGRKKELYISGGENVFPGEVERQIASHPEVVQVVVVGVPDEKWGETGLAFCVSRRPLTLEELRDFLNPRLARYKHPLHLLHLKEMPLLANGKINRPALKKQGKEWILSKQNSMTLA
ncbi:MAG: long-chain fatty acid--CoA ligase [Magnetococcales bacterium]|nr:AMP-binding protein [Magnetococcales bacterium]NGZ26360.1 long-chain fatty acid--CoA ligase [Magnetococcales bacterium]